MLSTTNPNSRGIMLLLLLALTSVAAKAQTLNVRAEPLSALLQVPLYSAPAYVVARNEPQLAAEIDARIIEIPLQVGDSVASGEVVARLDCSRYEVLLAAAEAELARADAQRRFASQQLVRARNLNQSKSISEELVDQRRADLLSANADVEARQQAVAQANIDVRQCAPVAPFDAVVTARLASVGGFASRGTPLLALLQTAGQEVSVALRSDEVAGVRNADSLRFVSRGQEYPVTLRAVVPNADPIARTQEARLRFNDVAALAGTAGRLQWSGARQQLPADYLLRRDGNLGIFVLDGAKARFVALPMAEKGRPTLVDLPPGTRLITDGRQRLNDGDAVRVIAGDSGKTP